jgi:hypothetical protein
MRSGIVIGLLACGALAASVTPAFATINFARTSTDTSVGTTPVAMVSADFNGDGKADLATANNDSDDVSVLHGLGDGTFLDSGASFQVGVAPSAIAVGDFNGDGKPDIVTADEIDNTVSVLLNQGTVFGSALTADTGSSPEGIAVGDFNGDGKLDVATADDFDDTVTILLGVGDGTFSPGHAIAVGAAPVGLVAVDLNGDGKLDLVVTNSSGGPDAIGTVTVLKGTGDGSFAAEPEIVSASFSFPTAIVSADFNGDGKPDLAVANQDNDTVTLLIGDGTGVTFQILTPSPAVAGLPWGIIAADFDGDGKMDIATSGNFDDKVSVLIGIGDGTFNPKVDFSVGTAPTGLVATDFNGDGKFDIATANEQDNTVSVLLNTTGQPLACNGDCDASGDVTVNEIIILVNMALGSQTQLSACPNGLPASITDPSQVDITLIISAVNNALNGCPK